MGAAFEKPSSTVDVDLVAAQFDVLDSDTHKTALLEAIRPVTSIVGSWTS